MLGTVKVVEVTLTKARVFSPIFRCWSIPLIETFPHSLKSSLTYIPSLLKNGPTRGFVICQIVNSLQHLKQTSSLSSSTTEKWRKKAVDSFLICGLRKYQRIKAKKVISIACILSIHSRFSDGKKCLALYFTLHYFSRGYLCHNVNNFALEGCIPTTFCLPG